MKRKNFVSLFRILNFNFGKTIWNLLIDIDSFYLFIFFKKKILFNLTWE